MQIMTSEEIDEAMERDKNLSLLYVYQKLSPSQIDKAIEMEKDLRYLYIHQNLAPSQIDRAIKKGEDTLHLYIHKTLTPSQIDAAMLQGEWLDDLYTHQKLATSQIDRAIDMGEDLYSLYNYQKLSPAQIDRAMDMGGYSYSLYNYQKLSPAQIDRAIGQEEFLLILYEHQKLSPSQIDRAIKIAEYLPSLYKYQKLTPSQIDRAIDEGEYIYDLYDHQKLTPSQINGAINRGIHLSNLYKHQMLTPSQIYMAIDKGAELYHLYHYQKLTTPQIDWAIEIGEDLEIIYEYQKLTPLQIDGVIEIGENIGILFTYQTPLPSHVQHAIDGNIALDFLYLSPLTSKEQKKSILKKLNIPTTERLLESEVWRSVPPRDLFEAVNIFNKSIADKIDRSPINDLVGIYPVTTPFGLIKLEFADKGYYIKEGDFDYGYYIDKIGREKKRKIGGILKKNPKLLAEYGESKPSLKSVYEKTKLFTPLSENLEIVISNNPIDVAGKSTGKAWTSCETISLTAEWGWPPKCGWCDDVKANNLIAYIRRVGETEWVGRNMIRWCIREDDNRPDVLIEKYYGDIEDANFPLYQWIMRNNLKKIVRSKGYSGTLGGTLCKTPYNFTGFVDSPHSSTRLGGPIKYHLGERGEGAEEEKEIVYHPKLVER